MSLRLNLLRKLDHGLEVSSGVFLLLHRENVDKGVERRSSQRAVQTTKHRQDERMGMSEVLWTTYWKYAASP